MIGYDTAKNEAYFQAIYHNAVALCADLCRQFQLDPLKPGVIICQPRATSWGLPATTPMCSTGGPSTG